MTKKQKGHSRSPLKRGGRIGGSVKRPGTAEDEQCSTSAEMSDDASLNDDDDQWNSDNDPEKLWFVSVPHIFCVAISHRVDSFLVLFLNTYIFRTYTNLKSGRCRLPISISTSNHIVIRCQFICSLWK